MTETVRKKDLFDVDVQSVGFMKLVTGCAVQQSKCEGVKEESILGE